MIVFFSEQRDPSHVVDCAVFFIEFPWIPSENEDLQSLISDHFRQNQPAVCQNLSCRADMIETSIIDILDHKEAIVIALNRLDLHANANANANQDAPKIDWEVKLVNEITLPIHGGMEVRYQLVSTLEQTGTQNAGHYTAHLKYNGEFYVASDNNTIFKSSETHYKPEKSTIFLFKRIDEGLYA